MLVRIWNRVEIIIEAVFPAGLDLGKVWLVGAVFSLVMSWTANKSIPLAMFHAMSSWLYVLYYALCN